MVPAFVAALVVGLIGWALCSRWWKLRQIEAALRKQGVRGPSSNPLVGGIMPAVLKLKASFRDEVMRDLQSHDILGRVLPDVALNSKQYGVPYFFWWMHEPKLVVTNPQHARELLSKQVSSTQKSVAQRRLLIYFLGHGLASVDGEDWVHHRRVVSPAFHLDKLKAMSSAMEKCTEKMLENWKMQIERGATEIEVASQFSKLTADIIAHTAFGSSYNKGQRFFHLHDTLGVLLIKSLTYDWVPFSRWVPNKHNRMIWKLETEIDTLLLGLMRERRDSVKSGATGEFGEDLLGLILRESEKDGTFDDRSLIGECKTFYFTGHETTASLLKWATCLLAINPDWQSRARQEVLSARSKNEKWNTDVLNSLKFVTMIIYETLRLYPPATLITRTCTRDVQIGDLRVPRGTSVDIPILAIHHDKELWGDDVHEFKPERFAKGVSGASKHPNAFMGFSFGPRICVGQMFALMEAKLVLAMLLERFSFGISPSYRHCPVSHLAIKPCHGLQIILQALPNK